MGWRQDGGWWTDSAGNRVAAVADFDPTSSWAAAGQVVKKMDALGWGMVHWNSWPYSGAGRGHAVRFYKGVYPPGYTDGQWGAGDMGRSFPLSCSLAALSALGIAFPD